MAYTKFEQAYVDTYLETMYPAESEQPDTLLASGPVKSDVQPEFGTIKGIPQTRFEKILEQSGIKLNELGNLIDEQAPGTLNSLTGKQIPIIGELKIRDLLPFVGSEKDGQISGTPGALIAAGTGQPLGGKPVVGSAIGPDGQTYYGTSGSPAMFNQDVGTAVVDVATLGLGKPLAKLGKKAIEATKDLPIGMSIKDVTLKPINPANFKPQDEVKSAIDFVSADPVNNIYVSQSERAPSVAFRIAKPQIIGTGKSNQITVEDVGTVLQKAQLSLYKNKPLDPTNIKDLTKMIDSASAEAEFQLAQPISGANWYDDDVTNAFKMSAKVVPELATDEPLRVLTTAFAASTSYNKRAGENWAVATKITEHLLKTGKVATRNPENGKLWAGTTGPIMEQQLKFHEFMLNKMGLADYTEWLLTPHAVKDIKAMKAESGLYKTIDVPGKATDMKMGSFVIGEKGGAFFLNLNGIKETTADKWFSRTYNRHAGSLTSGNISEQGLIDAPRNEAERSIMKEWNRGVASNSKLDEQANQAVLWFYEQNLYYNLGVKSAKSESFSDGARNLLNARGVQFDESELIRSGGGGNAAKAGAEPQSPTGTGDPVGVGEVAPVDAKPTTIKRGSKAPAKGVQ
jgi:hypothetical protein